MIYFPISIRDNANDMNEDKPEQPQQHTKAIILYIHDHHHNNHRHPIMKIPYYGEKPFPPLWTPQRRQKQQRQQRQQQHSTCQQEGKED
mmetsp:Transcript_789/g.1872  ORF Transcript_789/g.1872 Transcript_789/m.1872 type:complete len:89 (-) Transcript_789:451-717(-)